MPFYTPKTDWNTAFNNGQEIIKRFNYINENIQFIKREPNTYNGVKTYNDDIKTDSILSDNYTTLSLGGSSYPVYYKGGKVDYMPVSFSVATFNNHHLTNSPSKLRTTNDLKDWYYKDTYTVNPTTIEVISYYGYSGSVNLYKQLRIVEYDAGRGGAVYADVDVYLDDVLQFSLVADGTDLTLSDRVRYYNVGIGTVKIITEAKEPLSRNPNIGIRRARYPFVENEPVKVLNTSYTATENRVITLDDYNNNRLY